VADLRARLFTPDRRGFGWRLKPRRGIAHERPGPFVRRQQTQDFLANL
jgi:hypothetical protein